MSPRDRIKQRLFEKLGYDPSAEQHTAHFTESRTKILPGGERGGKSKWGSMELLGDFVNGPLYWLVGADYEQTRPEFGYIMDGLVELGVLRDSSTPKEGSQILIAANGTVIVTRSAVDLGKLGREAPDGILACEAGLLTYEVFLRLRGRVAEKRGWLALTGTFERSTGWYPELFEKGQKENPDGIRSFILPSWSNLHIYPGGENDPEILALKGIFPTDLFLERFGGVPVPPKGRVLKEFRVTLHCGNYAFDKNLPVLLWVDPGYAGAYAVEAVQIKNDTIYVFDEIYEQCLTSEEVIHLAKLKPWWQAVAGGAIDIAGRQHHADKSAEEIWRTKGSVVLNSQKIGIVDGIDRFRMFLRPNPVTGIPNFLVDHKCRGLIAEAGGTPNPIQGLGMWKYNMDREGNVVGEIPEDKNNHGCKAVIYGIVAQYGIAPRGRGRSLCVRSRASC